MGAGRTEEGVEAMANVPSPGRGEVRFDTLALQGAAAGRERFERCVTDIVKVIVPLAREVEAAPGDWGIDTFVGELDEGGSVSIWQSKYFLHPGDSLKSHQAEVRDSFKSAMKNAADKGYTVTSWTLALPGTMSPEMTKWFDGWRKRTLADHEGSLVIDVWQEVDLRGYLMKPDFEPIRTHYFGAYPQPAESSVRAIEDLEDGTVYDGALFIKQLHAADIRQDNTARRAFFNAEIMSRDINERESGPEVAELRSMRSTVEQMWSTRFEQARASTDRPDGRLPALFPDVCRSIESHHDQNPNRVLRDTSVHRIGLVHHLAEGGDVGWVAHFPDIAAEHFGDEAASG